MTSNIHFVHVCRTCPKCGGCVLECEHRTKFTTTTTATDQPLISPMTPNKSDSGEAIVEILVRHGLTDREGELFITDEGYDMTEAVLMTVADITAHIQAVGEEIIGTDETLLVDGYDQYPDHRVVWSASKLRDKNTPKIERNGLRAGQRKRLAQYLGEKQDD